MEIELMLRGNSGGGKKKSAADRGVAFAARDGSRYRRPQAARVRGLASQPVLSWRENGIRIGDNARVRKMVYPAYHLGDLHPAFKGII
jgi:hypothetical protein